MKDRDKKIDTLTYLESQKIIYKDKSQLHLKLNSFVIENGLGDIDGFVKLGNKKNVSLFEDDFDAANIMGGNNFKELMQNDEASGGQRFRNQFILLEKYESEYTDLSSSLKPNSETLTSLKIKIENLRESLKRPNEILVKFRELRKIAQRDESILTSIEDKLGFKIREVKKAKSMANNIKSHYR